MTVWLKLKRSDTAHSCANCHHVQKIRAGLADRYRLGDTRTRWGGEVCDACKSKRKRGACEPL